MSLRNTQIGKEAWVNEIGNERVSQIGKEVWITTDVAAAAQLIGQTVGCI